MILTLMQSNDDFYKFIDENGNIHKIESSSEVEASNAILEQYSEENALLQNK